MEAAKSGLHASLLVRHPETKVNSPFKTLHFIEAIGASFLVVDSLKSQHILLLGDFETADLYVQKCT